LIRDGAKVIVLRFSFCVAEGDVHQRLLDRGLDSSSPGWVGGEPDGVGASLVVRADFVEADLKCIRREFDDRAQMRLDADPSAAAGVGDGEPAGKPVQDSGRPGGTVSRNTLLSLNV